MKYNVKYLPLARKDIKKITIYISNTLKKYETSEKYLLSIVDAIENLSLFPYRNSVYLPVKELKFEYRKLLVKNFIVFYFVDEQSQTIVISRVLFHKRNHINHLK